MHLPLNDADVENEEMWCSITATGWITKVMTILEVDHDEERFDKIAVPVIPWVAGLIFFSWHRNGYWYEKSRGNPEARAGARISLVPGVMALHSHTGALIYTGCMINMLKHNCILRFAP